MTQDAEWKNYQLQWKTEKGGRSVSWNTEQARPDDDDDDDDDGVSNIFNSFAYSSRT